MNEPEHRAGLFAPSASPGRAAIRRALIELVAERGWETIALEDVLARSGVERSAFEADFEDLADCGVKVYLANIDNFDAVVFSAADAAAPWRIRLRVTAYAAARYVRDRPLETSFDMIQMVRVEDMARAHRDRYVGRIVDLIDEGRQELDDPDSVGRGVAEGVMGSIYSMLVSRVGDGKGASAAEDYVPELMYIAVRPYLGHEVAKEELEIPPPPEPGVGH